MRRFRFSIDGFGIETFVEAFLHFHKGEQLFWVGLEIEQFRSVADVVVILVFDFTQYVAARRRGEGVIFTDARCRELHTSSASAPCRVGNSQGTRTGRRAADAGWQNHNRAPKDLHPYRHVL